MGLESEAGEGVMTCNIIVLRTGRHVREITPENAFRCNRLVRIAIMCFL